MEYKLLSVVLMVALMAAIAAMPLMAAEEGDNVSLTEVTSENTNDSDNTVISPSLTETSNESTDIEDEAAEDDNATVGTGEIAWNHVKLWFTFNQEKKAELELKLARLSLIQARIAAKNNNTEAMQKALEAHERIIDRIQGRMNNIDGASNVKSINDTSAKLRGLERAIQVHEIRISRLNTLLENANLTDEQRAKVEARISHAENVTSHLKELNAEKKDKLTTKLMAIANLTEEQAKEIVDAGGKIGEQMRQKVKEKISDASESEAEDENESED